MACSVQPASSRASARMESRAISSSPPAGFRSSYAAWASARLVGFLQAGGRPTWPEGLPITSRSHSLRPAAGDSEQAELAITHRFPEVVHHRVDICASQPLRLYHARLPNQTASPNVTLSSGGRAVSIDVMRNQNRGRRLVEHVVRCD